MLSKQKQNKTIYRLRQHQQIYNSPHFNTPVMNLPRHFSHIYLPSISHD